MRYEIVPIQLSDLEYLRDEALSEAVYLREGSTPIQWLGLRDAVDGGRLMGCIGLLAPFKGKTTVRIRGWYVRPEHRGQGLGRWLLEEAVEVARAQGFGRVEMRTKYRSIAERMGGWTITDKRWVVGGQKTYPGPAYQLFYDLSQKEATHA